MIAVEGPIATNKEAPMVKTAARFRTGAGPPMVSGRSFCSLGSW
jgi:hypothetical protein